MKFMVLKYIEHSERIIPNEPLRLIQRDEQFEHIAQFKTLIKAKDDPNDTSYFMTTKYYEGGTLGNTKYGFSFNFVISVGKQLVQGLKDIHMKMSLIHRDIKLDNIALDQVVVENNEIQSAIIKVIDFESAVSIQNQGALEEEMYHATKSYRCPDDILLSTKSEIYALGLILFRMLYGTYGERDELHVSQNFKGQQDYTEQMKKSLDVNTRLHRTIMDDCRMKRLLKRMLSYNPHQRPELDEIDFELSIINTAVDPPIPLPCLRIDESYRQKRCFEPKSVYLEDIADMFNVDVLSMTPENILSFCDNNECAGLSSDYFIQDTCVMIICKIMNVEPHPDKNQTRKLCKLEKEHLNKLGYAMKEFELNLGQNLSRVNKLFEKQRKNKNPKEILDMVNENLEVNPNLKKTASDILQLVDMIRPQLNLLSTPSSDTENIDDGDSRFLKLFPISNGSSSQKPTKIVKVQCLNGGDEKTIDVTNFDVMGTQCQQRFQNEKLIAILKQNKFVDLLEELQDGETYVVITRDYFLNK
ncbi:predicted protein [Naegleria gruberi]|uniref:Predicted protein n=1 Tax=Naegleria gruberi TaxID=5762 RepID=D2W212_NAEGR|nr:uncharacterized protein NAEGRDRAFT_54080 [Naegleria gruberi]EFC36858.1 predicted protein [Naegleria gruberi]|eukprot:XP_002669602.1 predicted protein [Naegleria gruberi strain NEG-M]